MLVWLLFFFSSSFFVYHCRQRREKVCKQDDLLVQKLSGASIAGVLQEIIIKQCNVNATAALQNMQIKHIQAEKHVT